MIYPNREQWTPEQYKYLEELLREFGAIHGRMAILEAELRKIQAGHQETVHV